MSIASPRPSISSALRSPSIASSRTSLDLPQPQRSANPRRNRAALRDYYKLKPSDVTADNGLKVEEAEVSELDKEGFDAEAYIKDVLEKHGLDEVLKVEGGLVSDIRGLDGERKALVYDNYSKLIAATDTIRKMRTNMEPLTPATSTLAPAISHIAETATALSTEFASHDGHKSNQKDASEHEPSTEKDRQRETVRWVLDTPRRLREMLDNGQPDEAQADWDEVRRLLDKWQGVTGVDELRQECAAVMDEDESE